MAIHQGPLLEARRPYEHDNTPSRAQLGPPMLGSSIRVLRRCDEEVDGMVLASRGPVLGMFLYLLRSLGDEGHP